MDDGASVILRRPYKRGQYRAAPTLRRPYKRGRPPADEVLPTPPADTRPLWFRVALISGEIRCPRKWSSLSLEICAQIQGSSPEGCRAARCAFLGTAPMLEAEVRNSKKSGVAPKIGARGRTPSNRQPAPTAIDPHDDHEDPGNSPSGS